MLKELYYAIPKKIRYIILIGLLLICAYTGGYIKGRYFSASTDIGAVTQHVNAITEAIEAGERDSKVVSDGIQELRQDFKGSAEESRAIEKSLEESIAQSSDLVEQSRTIREQSQRIGNYSRTIEGGNSSLEERVSGAKELIDRLLKKD